MQTFLPYSDYFETVKCLDNKRLGKQRVEAKQILELLLDPEKESRWRNHPAVKLWDEYEFDLFDYGLVMCDEWSKRGYVDNVRSWFLQHLVLVKTKCKYMSHKQMYRRFISNDFHASHRAALLYKDSIHYSQFGWKETPEIKYVWS